MLKVAGMSRLSILEYALLLTALGTATGVCAWLLWIHRWEILMVGF